MVTDHRVHTYPWLLTTTRTHIRGYATVTAAPTFKSPGFCAKAFSIDGVSVQVYPQKGRHRSCQHGLFLYTTREENRG